MIAWVLYNFPIFVSLNINIQNSIYHIFNSEIVAILTNSNKFLDMTTNTIRFCEPNCICYYYDQG